MILFFLLLASFTIGQLGRVEIYPGVNLYLHDMVITVMAMRLFLQRGISIKDKLVVPLSVFSVVALLSLILNPLKLNLSQLTSSGLYLLRFNLYASVYFYLQKYIEKKNKEKIIYGIILVGVIVSILGFIQLWLYPDIRNISYLGWDPHFGRLVSTFLDPNFTGIILVLGLLPSLVIWCQEKLINKRKVICFTFFAIIFGALILTFSRSSWLAFTSGSFIVLLLLRKIKIFLALILILLICIVLVPKPKGEGGNLSRQTSVIARADNYSRYLKLFAEKPVIGYGFNTVRYLNLKYQLIPTEEIIINHAASGVDNSFLFILITTGIAGLSSYLFLVNVMLGLLVRNRDLYSLIILGSFGAIIVHSMFQNTLFYPWVMIFMWMIIALKERHI